MTSAEMDELVRRANASGFHTVADYAVHLEERLAETEEYANEGWAWLEDALDAAGWKTVFDIPKRAA